MVSKLYEHTSYLNKDIDFLKASIREYDMKDAGFSIIKNSNYLDKDTIKYLSGLEKHKRKVRLGVMMRDDKNVNRIINEGFEVYRKKFFEANDIKDEDVLSIKKDAIFLINKPALKTQFGDVRFDLKNKYSVYYRLNKLEIYYSKDKIDVKGIDDKVLKKHKKGFLKFFKKLSNYVVIGKNDRIIEYIREFSKDYLDLKLNVEYYRTFDSESTFVFKDKALPKVRYSISYCEEEQLHSLDIYYNYTKLILPLIQIFFK